MELLSDWNLLIFLETTFRFFNIYAQQALTLYSALV